MLRTEELRARMVADLLERGDLTEDWTRAFVQVPRHAFIPTTIWRHDRRVTGNDLLPLHFDDDPDGWLLQAYANTAVNTQVDDGRPAADGTGREVTSSASMPSVIAQMLHALDTHPGHSVLEIGTGTGYNAGLLAHRLGPEQVVTVEINPEVADHARRALSRTGYGKVAVLTADGTHGHPARAPYQRILATAGTREIPYTWVEQVVPGGRIVLPLNRTYHCPGILSLTVDDDRTACGRISGPAAFMALRSERIPRPHGAEIIGDPDTVSQTHLHPHAVAGDRDAATAIALRVDACHKHYVPDSPTTGTQWLLDPESRSWASVELTTQPPYPVRQGGPRRLWTEIESAHLWWEDHGRPPVSAWLVTVEPDGQRIELTPDTPTSADPTGAPNEERAVRTDR